MGDMLRTMQHDVLFSQVLADAAVLGHVDAEADNTGKLPFFTHLAVLPDDVMLISGLRHDRILEMLGNALDRDFLEHLPDGGVTLFGHQGLEPVASLQFLSAVARDLFCSGIHPFHIASHIQFDHHDVGGTDQVLGVIFRALEGLRTGDDRPLFAIEPQHRKVAQAVDRCHDQQCDQGQQIGNFIRLPQRWRQWHANGDQSANAVGALMEPSFAAIAGDQFRRCILGVAMTLQAPRTGTVDRHGDVKGGFAVLLDDLADFLDSSVPAVRSRTHQPG